VSINLKYQYLVKYQKNTGINGLMGKILGKINMWTEYQKMG
jgi:hypothetical protein